MAESASDRALKGAGLGFLVGGGCGLGLFALLHSSLLKDVLHPFFVLWVCGAIGMPIGYVIQLVRLHREPEAVSEPEWIRLSWIGGAMLILASLGCFMVITHITETARFVRNVRAVAQAGVIEIVLLSADPDPEPLVKINDEAVIKGILALFGDAKAYSPSHDMWWKEGRIKIVMEDGTERDWSWYIPKNSPGSVMLGTGALVPRLGWTLTRILEKQSSCDAPKKVE